MIVSEETRHFRFWVRVLPVQSGCWEWQGSSHKQGYPYIGWRGRHLRLNRLAYEMMKGTIPDGLHVMHSCDNRKCCNPDHLSAGTRTDNMRDMARKGRNYIKRPQSHCKRGHALTPENRSKSASARCLKCARLACRAKYALLHPGHPIKRSRKSVCP